LLKKTASLLQSKVHGLDIRSEAELRRSALEQAAAQCDLLVVAGGDGTMSMGINAIDLLQRPWHLSLSAPAIPWRMPCTTAAGCRQLPEGFGTERFTHTISSNAIAEERLLWLVWGSTWKADNHISG
jgi:hypothetical protein